MNTNQKFPFTEQEWESCIKVLTALKDNPLDNPDNQQFKTLVSSIYKKAKKDIRKTESETRYQEDFEKLKQTVIISKAYNNSTLFSHLPEVENDAEYSNLNNPQNCYVCHKDYTRLHFFYHKLCPECAELNYKFRQLKPNFKGYQVVITGGRVKIGYASVLLFLRAGAKVLVTTRFPALAWEQLNKEPDFNEWKDNLTVYGLDLRSLKAVREFIDFCNRQLTGLDILINNAAQTIKYPFEYYQPLVLLEKQNLERFENTKLLENQTPLVFKQEQLLESASITEFKANRFGQPVDFRDKNSWNSTLEEIGLEELLEVNLINHISPYLLISELTPLMERSKQPQRFIINVTSSEGQFSYANKTVFHPHTNMTKAALNMLTRTSAADFAEKDIYMNSVDVGWVSTGAAEEKRARLFEGLKVPPLDSVDGAMRIVQPILEVQNGNTELFGKLLKNYREVDW